MHRRPELRPGPPVLAPMDAARPARDAIASWQPDSERLLQSPRSCRPGAPRPSRRTDRPGQVLDHPAHRCPATPLRHCPIRSSHRHSHPAGGLTDRRPPARPPVGRVPSGAWQDRRRARSAHEHATSTALPGATSAAATRHTIRARRPPAAPRRRHAWATTAAPVELWRTRPALTTTTGIGPRPADPPQDATAWDDLDARFRALTRRRRPLHSPPPALARVSAGGRMACTRCRVQPRRDEPVTRVRGRAGGGLVFGCGEDRVDVCPHERHGLGHRDVLRPGLVMPPGPQLESVRAVGECHVPHPRLAAASAAAMAMLLGCLQML